MEETTTRGGQILPYTLCACTGAGIMFNLILLVWHCIKFKPQKSNKYIKYGLAFLYFAYILAGVSVSLLILYKDLEQTWLCKFGGFLILFASQECLWMISACCVLALLWQRTQFPWKPQAYGVKEHHKWGIPIFVLTMILKLVIVAIVSFLPLINLPFFDAQSEFYFLCTPMRLPWEHGWAYSTMILILDWVAIIVALTTLITSIYLSNKHSRDLNLSDGARKKPWTLDAAFCSRGVKQYTLRIHAVLAFNAICWLIVLIVSSITYFSGGSVISKNHVQWTLGFCISGTIMLHPIIFFIFILISEKKGLFSRPRVPCQSDAVRTDNWHVECPRSLLALSKLDDSHGQEEDITRYLVKWRDGDGSFVTGVMKVFHPSCQQKWRNEVNALSKLAPLDHPNVCRYLWDTPRNSFTSAICTFTGDVLSQEGSITCRLHYATGTLQEFLGSRIQQLTEVGLHKITLDVANGLEYLHQHHLVHNGLSTQTVYMASISEKIGMNAVIGDFENSYEVSENTLRKSPLSMIKQDGRDLTSAGSLFSISNTLDMDNNKFAPDIRSFGLVVLEMLVSMSEFNQKRTGSKSLVAKTLAEIQGDLNVDLTSALNSHQGCDGGAQCQCSSRVTDIRVCKDRPDQRINLHPDFDAIHQHAFSRPSSASNTPSSDMNSAVWLTPAQVRQLELEQEAARDVQDIQMRDLPPIPRIERTNLEESPYPKSLDEFDAALSEDGKRSDGRRSRGRPKRPVHSLPFQRPEEDSSESETELVSIEAASPHRRNSHKGRERHSSGKSDVSNSTTNTPATVRSVKIGIKKEQNKEELVGSVESAQVSRPASLTTRNVRKLSEQHDTGQLSPSTPSEDIYNTSIGSLGSFDTIYEDEEIPKGSQPMKAEPTKPKSKSSKRGQRGPHLGKRRLDDSGQKRMSTASMDESLISADSGVGSSHYDMYSNGLRHPGSRDTIYAESSSMSDADSYSLLKAMTSKHGKRGPDSGIESNVESCDELARYEKPPCHPGRAMKKSASTGDEPEVFPDLRVRKRPCTRDHTHPPGVPCTSQRVLPIRQVSQMDSTSSASPSSTPESEDSPVDPVYEKIPPKMLGPRFSSMPKSNSSCFHHHQSGCQFCPAADDHIMHSPEIVHPAIRSQYRHAMPKLGVSAVTSSRRMSDVSSTSSSNGTLNSAGRSMERRGDPNSAPTSPCSGQKTLDFNPSSQESIRDDAFHHVASNSSLASSVRTVPNYGSQADENKNSNNSNDKNCEQQSVSDSLKSLIEDSKALLASLEESTKDLDTESSGVHQKKTHSRGHHDPTEIHNERGLVTPSSDISALSSSSRAGLGHKQLQYFREMTKGHPSLNPKVLMDSNQDKLKQMLELVKKSGKLGFVAQQLLPLLSDCWLEDPAPSAEEILRRLENALPTASV